MRPYKLMLIDPRKIIPDERNPRGESKDQIEMDSEFIRLKDSVYEHGVLVPLIVRHSPKNPAKFILVDGERRLRAAWATNQKKVPAHVLSQNDIDSKSLMRAFQIHMLRKQWPKIAQARSLRAIIEKIKKESAKVITKKELVAVIQEETGYTDTTLRDMLRAIKYGDNVFDEVEDSESLLRFSHLIQIEASFIEPITTHLPEMLSKYSESLIRAKMLKKARLGFIESTRDLMDSLLPLFSRAEAQPQKQFLMELLTDFINEPAQKCSDVVAAYEKRFPLHVGDIIIEIEKIKESISNLKTTIDAISQTELASYGKLKKEYRALLAGFKKYLAKKLIKIR